MAGADLADMRAQDRAGGTRAQGSAAASARMLKKELMVISAGGDAG
jgi:hypothetical protein